MKFCGIDPGNNGGVALLEDDHIIECFSMPCFEEKVSKSAKGKVRKELDFDQLIHIFGQIKFFSPQICTLEQVWAQPQDSSMTAFALGGSYKLLRGLLHTHGLKYQLIAPGSWKRSKEYNTRDHYLWGAGDYAKDVAIDLVKEIYPCDFDKIRPFRKGSTTVRNNPHDGRADAVLIGRFGMMQLCNEEKVA